MSRLNFSGDFLQAVRGIVSSSRKGGVVGRPRDGRMRNGREKARERNRRQQQRSEGILINGNLSSVRAQPVACFLGSDVIF